MPAPSNPIVLYDGVCGLCNRLVRFILRRDVDDQFRFASLQSPLAAEILERHGIVCDLNTVYVVLDYQQPAEQLLPRSTAVLFVLKKLRHPWPLWGNVGYLLPRPLRDVIYNRIARNRYRIWGKYDSCPLPDAKHSHKFLDVQPEYRKPN
jgi:predicted DCC family thiol-disulfide oxidoreductase YuxK